MSNVLDKPLTIPDRISMQDLKNLLNQELGKPYKVLLWNDPVNTMDHVIFSLVKIIDEITDIQQAADLMLVAHIRGNVQVARCAKEKADQYRERLEAAGLTATVESDE